MSPIDSSAPGAHWYDACGIRLRSELAIPGLAPAVSPEGADILVVRGPVEAPDRWPASGIAAWPSTDADVISWAGRATLRIAASEIRVDSENEPFARQCVVGPGLGVALHRRGRLVLHGSAVDVGGQAVVLLGQKGAGKSTTAAALLDRGHALLTDDLVTIVAGADGTAHCAPGPTQMKLWPSSAEAFGLGEEVQPFLDGLEKGVWFGASVASGPVPIALVCSLAWGEPVELRPLQGAAAFGAVFEHAYAPRFLGTEAGVSLVSPCARLCQEVPIARLIRPQQLGAVGAVLDVLFTDAALR